MPSSPDPSDDRPAELRFIERSSGWIGFDWRELWRYRDLLLTLAARDVQVRYKQTVLGVAWAVLQPLALMATFYWLFGRFGGLAGSAAGIPYGLFVLVGLLPWIFVSSA